jgi:hypothetical protein
MRELNEAPRRCCATSPYPRGGRALREQNTSLIGDVTVTQPGPNPNVEQHYGGLWTLKARSSSLKACIIAVAYQEGSECRRMKEGRGNSSHSIRPRALPQSSHPCIPRDQPRGAVINRIQLIPPGLPLNPCQYLGSGFQICISAPFLPEPPALAFLHYAVDLIASKLLFFDIGTELWKVRWSFPMVRVPLALAIMAHQSELSSCLMCLRPPTLQDMQPFPSLPPPDLRSR